MTDRKHPEMGDPESGQPPINVPITGHDAAPAAPAYATAGAMARLASALWSGFGHVLAGAWVRGLSLMFVWAALVALLYFAWDRIFGIRKTGSLDDYVAVVTLAILLV